MSMADENKNPFVAITVPLAGIFFIIVVMFLIFAKDNLQYLIPIVWAFVVLGAVANLFALLSLKKKK